MPVTDLLQICQTCPYATLKPLIHMGSVPFAIGRPQWRERLMHGDRAGSDFDIRPAGEADVDVVMGMIRSLADFERLSHLCVATGSDLAAALFGPQPAAEVLIAWHGDDAAGFALFFHNYSTFLGRRGLWLEDLFVEPAWRRRGCARAMLRALAILAAERNCGRFEWSVLDWNASAIDFYRSLGATVLPDWRIVRVVGPALEALAGPR
jgi:GNAT superfamily N-acetyltransferase